MSTDCQIIVDTNKPIYYYKDRVFIERCDLNNLNWINFPIYLNYLALYRCYDIPIFNIQLPPNLKTLTITDCDLIIFKSELPSSLKALTINRTTLIKFDTVLPNKLNYLNLRGNNLMKFNSIIPSSLRHFILQDNCIKKLKVKIEDEFYDVKNIKTCDKRQFYKN